MKQKCMHAKKTIGDGQMNFEKLIEAHKLFYGGWEYRAPYYDEYMESKNWNDWKSSSVSTSEIEKLFSFIRKWDFHFHNRMFYRCRATAFFPMPVYHFPLVYPDRYF